MPLRYNPLMPDDDWITSTEALQITGFNADYLRRILRSGKVKARKWGREWQVSKSSLLKYLRTGDESPDKRRGPRAK